VGILLLSGRHTGDQRNLRNCLKNIK